MPDHAIPDVAEVIRVNCYSDPELHTELHDPELQALIIVAGVAIGFATALVGLAVTVPLLGHCWGTRRGMPSAIP